MKSKKGLALGKVAIVFLIVLALALVSYKIWKAAGGWRVIKRLLKERKGDMVVSRLAILILVGLTIIFLIVLIVLFKDRFAELVRNFLNI